MATSIRSNPTPHSPAAPVAEAVTAPANNPLGVILALLTVYIIWGSTYLAIHFALAGFPPFLMAAIRFLIAGGGLFLFLRARGTPVPTRAQWGGAAIVGALLLMGGNGGVVFAEQWVTSGLAAVGVATVPLWTALFAGLFGRWPTRGEWAGLALGFAGVALLSLEGGIRANPLGAVALLVSSCAWALGTVWSSRLAMPGGAMASAVEMLAGGSLLLILSLGLREPIPTTVDWQPLLAVGYLVVFGSVVAFTAYGYLLRHVRPALATSYAYVNPVVAVALGAALAGERITVIGMLAMAAILGGVALMTLVRQRG